MKRQMAGSDPAWSLTGFVYPVSGIEPKSGKPFTDVHPRRASRPSPRLSLRVNIHAASAALILALGGCALKHPIQPIAKDYTVPQQWARIGCTPRGDTYEGLPVLTCPDGLRMVDQCGKEVEFVSWKEIRARR